MTEAEFWVAMEYRITREFAGTVDGQASSAWCDGLIPEYYLIALMKPKIIGRAWVCHGHSQDAWSFVLWLVQEVDNASEIDWALHLPGDEMTGWLTYNKSSQRIEIDPRSTVRQPE